MVDAPDTRAQEVCVIIPAYRARATVARAIRSAARQTHAPTRIVVVDDGSDDGSAEEARRALDDIEGIATTLCVQNHSGAGAARNAGLRAAKEPIAAFLDADDEWLPNKLERSLAVMRASGAQLVSHDYIRVPSQGEAGLVSCSTLFEAGTDNYHALYRKGFIATSTVTCERQLLLDAGGFDEGLANAQDFDLWLRVLARRGARVHVFAEPLCRYYVTAGSITQSTERRLACCTKVALRHFGNLKGRQGNPWFSLWYRIAAIHWEAFQSYAARANFRNVLRTGAVFPVALVSASFQVLSQTKSVNDAQFGR